MSIQFKYITFVIFFTFFSCNLVEKDNLDFTSRGLKPIYGESEQLQKVEVMDSSMISSPGKIVLKHPYLYINDKDKGIHIINNKDPLNPVKEAFISIPLNRDLAVKGNIIFADNNRDLIMFKYISKDSIELLQRKNDVFDRVSALPADYFGYFECVDESKGAVVGWEEVELSNPKCHSSW